MAKRKDGQCLFCKRTAGDRDKVGQTLQKHDVIVHQYCLYFASGLHQRGEEGDGIQGFLLPDIRKEISRACRLTCKFCHLKGAATGCAIASCRQTCHAPCGFDNGFMFHHRGQFEAYCRAHKPSQSQALLTAALNKTKTCCLCLAEIESTTNNLFSILVCPVCETGFHRTCLQKQAWMSGTMSSRCPVCANRDQFTEEMMRLGLEVPEKHTEGPNGAAECQAATCLCPDGRAFYTRMSKYRMKACHTCAKVLGHMVCVKGNICSECKPHPPDTDRLSCMSSVPPVNGLSDTSEVGVAPQTQCDCIICKARALTPDSRTASVEPSLPSPSPRSPSRASPTQLSSLPTLPPSTLPPLTPSQVSPPPAQPSSKSPISQVIPTSLPIRNSVPNRVQTNYLSAANLHSLCPSQDNSEVSPIPSTLAEPPTPALLSPTLLSPTLLSPTLLSPALLSPTLLSPALLTPTHLTPTLLTPTLLSPTRLTPSPLSPSPLPTPSPATSRFPPGGHPLAPPFLSLPHALPQQIVITTPRTAEPCVVSPPLSLTKSPNSRFEVVSQQTASSLTHQHLPPDVSSTTTSQVPPSHARPQSISHIQKHVCLPPQPCDSNTAVTSSEQDLSSPNSSVCSYFRYVNDVMDVEDKMTSSLAERDCHNIEMMVNIPRVVHRLRTPAKRATPTQTSGSQTSSLMENGISLPVSYVIHKLQMSQNSLLDTRTANTADQENAKSVPQQLEEESHNHTQPPNTLSQNSVLRGRTANDTSASSTPGQFEGASDAHKTVFTVSIPQHHLSQTSRERLRRRKRESNDCTMVQFLRSQGLAAKFPRIILHRANH